MLKIGKFVSLFCRQKLFISRFGNQCRDLVYQCISDFKTFHEFLKDEGLLVPKQHIWYVVKEFARLLVLLPFLLLWSILFLPLLADYLNIYSIENNTQKILIPTIFLIFWLIQLKVFMISKSLTIFIILFYLLMLYYNYSFAPPYRYNLLDYIQSWFDFAAFVNNQLQHFLEWLHSTEKKQLYRYT